MTMTLELIQQLRGRAAFLRDKGRVKSPQLMEQAANELEAHLTQPAQAVDVGAGSAHRDECPVKMARAICDAIVKHQFQDEHRRGRLTVDVETFLHELNAARDAGLTRALSAEAGWRDMDRAPKDGTDILATDGTAMLVTYWYGASIGWLYSYSDHDVSGWHPTHWMPLPASLPASKEG